MKITEVEIYHTGFTYSPIPDGPGLGVELNDEALAAYSCIRVK